MSNKKEESKNKTEFTFQPHAVIPTDDGMDHKIDHKNSNPYIILNSATQGDVYYTPKTNQFWSGEKSLMSESVFQEKFLPYLRWKYDKLEEIVEEVKVAKGKDVEAKKVGTGKFINTFPCTPENIQKKRNELIKEALTRSEMPNVDDINQMTSPHSLLNTAEVEAQLGGASSMQNLIRRIKGY